MKEMSQFERAKRKVNDCIRGGQACGGCSICYIAERMERLKQLEVDCGKPEDNL